MRALITALRSLILADTAIAALIDDRLGPRPLERAAGLPAMTYALLPGQRLGRTLEPSAPPALIVTRVQLDHWSDRSGTTLDIAALVIARCEPFCGLLGGVAVAQIAIVDAGDSYTAETGLYRATQRLIITHAP